jgi:hypothetical protein
VELASGAGASVLFLLSSEVAGLLRLDIGSAEFCRIAAPLIRARWQEVSAGGLGLSVDEDGQPILVSADARDAVPLAEVLERARTRAAFINLQLPPLEDGSVSKVQHRVIGWVVMVCG